MKLGDIGEKVLISRIQSILPMAFESLDNDDVADMRVNNILLALKVDGFSVSSIKLPWLTWSDIGWKAVTAVTSDFIVKGARPLGYLVSIGVTRDFECNDFLSLIQGVKDAMNYYNVKCLGGDLNSTDEGLWIDIAGIGMFNVKPIPISAGEPKCAVLVTGMFGLTGMAINAYLKGRSIDAFKKCIESIRRPKVNTKLLDLISRYRECIYASTDVSDGLAFSLWNISRRSRICIRLTSIPIHEEVREYARIYGEDPIQLALYGGEEYEAILLVDKKCLEHILNDANAMNIEINVIGSTLEGKGVFYEDKIIEPIGWDNLKGYTKL